MEITNNLGLKCPEKNETFDVEHMNDNMRILDEIWQAIYPVGSIYLSINAVSPEVFFGGGTWELIATDRIEAPEGGGPSRSIPSYLIVYMYCRTA